jgi:hypothetical protein
LAVTPTLPTIQALFWKLEREFYRSYHSRMPVHKADHFYNFCITAHALRAYYIERTGPYSDSEATALHAEWSREPVLAAVADIANTAKHFTLRDSRSRQPRAPRLKSVGPSRRKFWDVYQTHDGRLFTNIVSRPDLTVTLADGQEHELSSFLVRVLDYWRTFLREHQIRVRRQPLSLMGGA